MVDGFPRVTDTHSAPPDTQTYTHTPQIMRLPPGPEIKARLSMARVTAGRVTR